MGWMVCFLGNPGPGSWGDSADSVAGSAHPLALLVHPLLLLPLLVLSTFVDLYAIKTHSLPHCAGPPEGG